LDETLRCLWWALGVFPEFGSGLPFPRLFWKSFPFEAYFIFTLTFSVIAVQRTAIFFHSNSPSITGPL